MPNFRDITGLTNQQAADAIPIASIPGDEVIVGPLVVVITATAEGLEPSDPSLTIQLFPTGAISSGGSDSNGNNSVTKTLTNNGDDKIFNITGGGTVTFPDGFWASSLRSVCPSTDGTRGFDLQYIGLSLVDDFNETLADSPAAPTGSNEEFDPDTEEGDIELDWTYTGSDNPDGFAIERDGVVVGSVPASTTTFTDYVTGPGPFVYTIIAYKYGVPNQKSAPSATFTWDPSTSPDANITMEGGIDLGGAPNIVFIVNPSGIYTLVTTTTHDTLYERPGTTTGNTTVAVKIPDPFIVTGFLDGNT